MSKHLERALLFTLFAHLAACVAMGLFLLPGMPGGGQSDPLMRAAFIADHPVSWRVGFFFWHLVSLSDLLLSLALLGAAWRAAHKQARMPAVLALILTLVALALEQPCEVLWETRMMDLAKEAVATGSADRFLALETPLYILTAAWSTLAWTATALCWSWTLARLGVWQRGLTVCSAILWGWFAVIGWAPLAPRWPWLDAVVVVGNMLGFALMLVWFAWVAELALRARRPETALGHWAPWRHPGRGPWPRLLDLFANSRLVRWCGERLPATPLTSDIRDVVYVNFLVDADLAARLVPTGLEPDRVGKDRRFVVCSMLAFRHGHYGPRCLGPLRRLFPSPLQANWRVHVKEPATGEKGIAFLANAVTHPLYMLGARMLAENISMHLPAAARHVAAANGELAGTWAPGQGSAPEARFHLRPDPHAALPEDWRACFGDFAGALAYIVPQEQTFAAQPWHGRNVRQAIRLGLDLGLARRLQGDVACPLFGDAKGAPLCFVFDQVRFDFDGERKIPWPPPLAGNAP